MSNRFNQRTSPQGTPYRDWWIDNVECPFCGSAIGERCVMRRTSHLRRMGLRESPYGQPTHKSRKDVAKTLYLLALETPKERFPEMLDLTTA